VPVVYASGTLSLALVEILVHLTSAPLAAYSAVPLEFPEALVTIVELNGLPKSWRDSPAPPETRAIGDKWVADRRSAALRVPSVVVPGEHNYVLNPNHPDFRRVRLGAAVPFPFDPRLPRP